MRIQHRVPFREVSQNMTGRLDPAYEREVEAYTARLERDYANAQKRLEAAERKQERLARLLEAATSSKSRKRMERDAQEAWALVEERRLELMRLSSMMTAVPASASHRGTKSFTKVPRTTSAI